MRHLWKSAWKELHRKPGRAAGTTLVYVLAMLATTVLVAVTVFDTDHQGARLLAYVPAAKAAAPAAAEEQSEGGLCVRQTPTALFSEAVAQEFRQAPMKNAAAFLVFQFRDTETGRMLTVGGLRSTEGCMAGVAECAGCRIASGRIPDPDDRGWVLLRSEFAEARKLTMGGQFTVAGEAFDVRSVVEPLLRPVEADLYIQIDDARRIAGKLTGQGSLEGQANVLLLEVERRTETRKAVRFIRERHPEFVLSEFANDRPLKAMRLPAAVAWLVILLIGLFAVAWATCSQMSSVAERQPDFRVLKGAGWTDRNLAGLVFTETGIQAVWASVFGLIVVSMVLEHVPLDWLSGLNPRVEFSAPERVVLVGLLVSLTGWLVAGGVSALKVAGIQPSESPSSSQAS